MVTRVAGRAGRSGLLLFIGCTGWLAIPPFALAQVPPSAPPPSPPSVATQAQPVSQAELEELKSRVQRLQEQIEAAQKEVKPPQPTFRQKVQITGDMGYRYEGMWNVAHMTGEDSYRPRYRLRINGYYQVNPFWEAGFRIMNADPRYPSTGWETFGQSPSPNEFSGPESGSGRSGFVNFDRMFIRWTPTQWFQFQMGKNEIPIWKPWMVWGSSVWHDDDVQPAGTFETFILPSVGALKNLRLVFGQVHLDQYLSSSTNTTFRVSPTRGAHLWVNQISGVVAPTPDLDISWGLGYYVFDNIGNFARGVPQAMTAGTYRNRSTNIARRAGAFTPAQNFLNCSPFASLLNTLPACDRYLSEYRLGNASIEFYWKAKYPVRFAADVVYNFGAAEYLPGQGKRGLAWLTHFSVGSFREPGEMQFGAGYYWGQADATWAVYADDDYLNTNVNTAMFNWKWKIFKDVIVVWDNYIRRWNDSQLAIMQGIVPNAAEGNATFTSSRITFVVSF
jgi:hypothetical protein